MKKILFITEALSAPFDEGIENIALSIHKHLEVKTELKSITKAGNHTNGLNVTKISMNKLFFNVQLRRFVREFSPDVILYLPEASITFNSFLRAKILKLMNYLSKVALIGVKPVYNSYFQKKTIVNLLKPDLLLTLGDYDDGYFRNNGMAVKALPPAVDSVRFRMVSEEEKKEIRAEYGIAHYTKVILHVGHIRSTRNVESLLKVQDVKGVQVLIVGSTSTPVDECIKNKLIDNNVMVIDEYIDDISRIYKMSDIYVFPVFNRIASIHMPLSILEAMACNLPVVTTRFGGLPEHFKEDTGFRYFNSQQELIAFVEKLIKMDTKDIHNSEKVKYFTWDNFTDEIITALKSSTDTLA
jgi:glycosyltransferase involved in cell wall biosynthesis